MLHNSMTQILDWNSMQWVSVVLAAILVGFSKTGIGGVMMLAIPLLAAAFGGKDSTGIMLPMLLIGDLFAIWYYHRSAEWKKIIVPLPWALVGLAFGAAIGKYISDDLFIKMIGGIILICLGILIYMELIGQNLKVPDKAWFYIIVGVLSGFSSMIGNAAGPIFSVYLLALGFKKNNFMGINACFFFLINFTKVPLQVFIWHNIGLKSLLTALIMIPVITLGAILGAYILKKINEKYFRYLVIVMTAIASVRLLI